MALRMRRKIDVPAPDEQRVRNTHESRITCNEPDCPGSVRHVDGAKGHIRRHTRGNMPALAAIPGRLLDGRSSPGGAS